MTLIGDWPIQRLEVYARTGVLDRLLNRLCDDQLRWHTTYAGVPGAATYALRAPLGTHQHPPDIVAVSYGQLDVVLTEAGKDPVVFERNLGRLTARIREQCPQATLVLMTSIPFREEAAAHLPVPARPGGWEALLETNANRVTRHMAHTNGWPLLDLHRVFGDHGAQRLLSPPDRFPNAPGRQLLARTICEGLAQLARARLLEEPAALQAQARATELLAQSGPLVADAPARAWALLREAADLCPYQASLHVAMDALAPRAGLAAAPRHVSTPIAPLEGVRQLRLVLLGDSVTALSLGQPAMTGAFEAALTAECGDRLLWDVVNQGVGGETAPMALRRIQRVLDQCQPDVITVSYGLNDLGFTAAKTDSRVFETSLRALLDAIQTHPCRPTVILLTATPFRDDIHFLKDDPAIQAGHGINAMLASQINSMTTRIAQERDLPLLDMFRLLMAADPATTISKDGVHPSAAGGKLLAEHIPHAIGRYICARELKLAEAGAAEERARALLREARDRLPGDPATARARLEAAALACPYLPEIHALFGALPAVAPADIDTASQL